MNYKLGNSKRVLELGETQEQLCPACDKSTVFPVYKNGNLELIGEVPFIDTEFVYFTVCQQCKKCFCIQHQQGIAFEKGDKWAIRSHGFFEPRHYNL